MSQPKKAHPVAKRAVPQIRARELLTNKARAAIECYALHRCGEARIATFLIKFTLDAERMRRADLYAYLEQRGYRWSSASSTWRKKMQEPDAGA